MIVAFLLAMAMETPGPARSAVPPSRVPLREELLGWRGFGWIEADSRHVRMRAARGSPAAKRLPDLAAAGSRALDADLALVHESWRGSPIQVFLFSSSKQLEGVVGHETNGEVRPGEDTVLLVYDGRRPPVLRHELMHVVVNRLWGPSPDSADWLSEGIATWSVGSCQGRSLDELAAGIQAGRGLPTIGVLAARFRSFDELTGYVLAGSVVRFVVDRYGVGKLRSIWRTKDRATHPLGPGGGAIETAWQRHIQSTRPRFLDVRRVQALGCEEPI